MNPIQNETELMDIESRRRESLVGLPRDVVGAFDEIEKYRNDKISSHHKLRTKLLATLSGNKMEYELNGWKKFMRKIEDENVDKMLKSDISSFKYGTDVSYLRSSSPDDVWETIKRRAAWKSQPLRMLGLTFTQIALCVIVIVSSSSPINQGTLIMAVLFILATGASNPMKITKDVFKMIENGAEKIGWIVMSLILIILFPIVGVVFTVTGTLDLVVGEILDLSFAGMCNIIVRVIVVFTAISVGLRSGNPINAIQTFAGFDFIDGMDELVIDNLDIDYEELANEGIEPGDSRKILAVRIAIYVATPIIIGCFLYITIDNNCYAFCATDDSLQ